MTKFNKLDPYTVEVTYEQPYAPALGSWGQSMLPAHLLEGQDVTKSPLKRNPVGTGPYRFVEWKTGEKIIVDSYHDYFEGRPYIDRVLTRTIPDLATMFLELKAGRLDQIGLTPLQYMRQTDTQWFKDNFVRYKYLSSSYNLFRIQLAGLEVQRQKGPAGAYHGHQRQSIVDGVLLGLGQRGVHAVQARHILVQS